MSEKRLALIIACHSYQDKKLQRLVAPANDAKNLAELLKEPTIGGFNEVTTLIDQPTETVKLAITQFFDKKMPRDLLLLYFSGHGIQDKKGRLYLATQDTKYDSPKATAIEAKYITEDMDDSRSKRQVLILDCCYSGAFATGMKKSVLGTSVGTNNIFEGNGYGRIVLTATDTTQFAWEGEQIIGETKNSLFTHYLIEGIKTGEASPNSEWITVNALYDYVYEHVSPHKTPLKWSYKQEGDIILARNPHPKESDEPYAYLFLKSEGKVIARYGLILDEVTIGRNPKICNIPIPRQFNRVSGVHIKITRFPGNIFVEDVSTNGTFINGKRLDKPIRLMHGQEILLGGEKPDNKVGVLEFSLDFTEPSSTETGTQQ